MSITSEPRDKSNRDIKKEHAREHIEHADIDTEEASQKVQNIVVVNQFRVLGLNADDADFYNNFSPKKRKKVVRKVDIRLVPILAVLYLISHLDRANIGNAKIEGLEADLGLSGVQWNIVLSIFFIPYVLFEVPSNILLQRFKRPSVYIGTLVTCWGIVMTLTGVVKNFAGLMVTRVLLGIFEAGFYPGAVYLCSLWYLPRDLGTRIACFYFSSALSGAFSGLLAAGIAEMDGVGGYAGWRWIFLIEGIATTILGVGCFFCLIDSPALSGRWLESDEIRYLEIQAFIKDGGNLSETEKLFQLSELIAVLKNWRLYMQAFILFSITACSYGLKFTLPSITKGMGFTNSGAQLLTVPPYIAGAIAAIAFAKLSDRFYWRMPFIIIPLCLIVTGFSIIFSFSGDPKANVGLSFFAIILVCMGIYPVQPAGSSWASNNLTPSSRRAIGVAFNICMGNIGGVLGSYIYLDSEAPHYQTGFGTSLALGAAGIVVATLLELSYWVGNKQKAKYSEDEIRQTYTEQELLKMGDKSPLFKYIL